MDPIPQIPINNNTIITPTNSGVSIRFIRGVDNRLIRVVTPKVREIADQRVWMYSAPLTNVPQVPVTTLVGTPIVNMPGCVAVHKENSKQRSKNKQLVNDDPKGNTVLCDGGMPYFNPPDYQYNRLTWQTFYGDQPEAGGVDTGDPPAPVTPETPAPPVTPPTSSEDVPCPPPNAKRIGDLNQAGTERVKEYELQPDPANRENEILLAGARPVFLDVNTLSLIHI